MDQKRAKAEGCNGEAGAILWAVIVRLKAAANFDDLTNTPTNHGCDGRGHDCEQATEQGSWFQQRAGHIEGRVGCGIVVEAAAA